MSIYVSSVVTKSVRQDPKTTGEPRSREYLVHFNRRAEGKCSSSPRHHGEATAGQLGVTFACWYSCMVMERAHTYGAPFFQRPTCPKKQHVQLWCSQQAVTVVSTSAYRLQTLHTILQRVQVPHTRKWNPHNMSSHWRLWVSGASSYLLLFFLWVLPAIYSYVAPFLRQQDISRRSVSRWFVKSLLLEFIYIDASSLVLLLACAWHLLPWETLQYVVVTVQRFISLYWFLYLCSWCWFGDAHLLAMLDVCPNDSLHKLFI